MNQFSGNLKNDCSIQNPVITLDLTGWTYGDISKFNWGYIPLFHRYYWVSDIKWVRGLWDFYLTVDVLASYKSTIEAENLYVLRSSYTYDGSIIDNMYPVKTGCAYDVETLGDFWPIPGGHTDVGCYCIGVSSGGGSYGSIEYYLLSRTSMVVLITHLLNDAVITNNGFSVDDASLALQKSLIDPLSYIKSCTYIPVALADISTTAVSQITVFDYTFSVPAYKPNSMRVSVSHTFTRPTHPDTNSRGNYVNCAPYTQLTLNIPPFGLIELDTTVTCDVLGISAIVTIDLAGGSGRLEVAGGTESGGTDPVLITSVKGQVGVPVSLSQVTRDYMGAVSTGLGAVTKAAAAAFLGATSGIGSAADVIQPHLSTIGQTGAFSDLYSFGGWSLTGQFFRPVADDNTHHGRPLCQNKVLSTIPGYIIVQDGDIPLPRATKAEAQAVKNYLETGFYLE